MEVACDLDDERRAKKARTSEGDERTCELESCPVSFVKPVICEFAQRFVEACGPRIVVVDCETTGLTNDDEIVELAAVEILDLSITGLTFHSLIRPTKEHRQASQKHRINPKDLEVAPTFSSVAPQFLRFLNLDGGAKIVGHNVSFDARMIQKSGEALEHTRIFSHCLCTMELFRSVFPTQKAASLSDCCYFFGIEVDHSHLHCALEDATLTAKVLIRLIATVNDL